MQPWKISVGLTAIIMAGALMLAGAGGQITQVPGPEFYTMEWTSNGPRSNLESGLVPGGRSAEWREFPEVSETRISGSFPSPSRLS